MELITQARDEALSCLLYLFERDEAIPLTGAGKITPHRHCEERSDDAIQNVAAAGL